MRVVRHIAGLVRIQLDSEMRAFRGIGPQFPSVLQVGDSRRCHVNSLPKIGYFGSGHPRTMTWAEAASVESGVGMSDTCGYLQEVYVGDEFNKKRGALSNC